MRKDFLESDTSAAVAVSAGGCVNVASAATASSAAGIKEHNIVSIRNRRLHGKNARKCQCDEQYKMYYQ